MTLSQVLTTLAVGSAILTPAGAAGATDAGLDVGDRFPELVLPSLTGEPTSIASFRGRKLVLHVWASW